jgi:hypothetical protein
VVVCGAVDFSPDVRKIRGDVAVATVHDGGDTRDAEEAGVAHLGHGPGGGEGECEIPRRTIMPFPEGGGDDEDARSSGHGGVGGSSRPSAALRRWRFMAFLRLEMARLEKQFELKPVDDAAVPVISPTRLENSQTRQRPKSLPTNPPAKPAAESHRLEVPTHPEYEARSHQPNIDALIDAESANPDFLEQDWGSQTTPHWRLPWGWLVLLGLIFVGGVVWSLTGTKTTTPQRADVPTVEAASRRKDQQEDQEAKELLDRINQVTRQYYAATSVDDLVRLTRHPERVRPLMERHYHGQKIKPNPFVKLASLEPLTVAKRGNFWFQNVCLTDQSYHQPIVEILEGNQPKIDWESEVCYQPMPWDRFTSERPPGTSLDFRVFIKPDNFYSHEFTEAAGWKCFELATRGSTQTVFGYVRGDSDVAQYLAESFAKNGDQELSLILRLSLPVGIQSRRGVVIEKLTNPYWVYLDPPTIGK